MKKFNINQFYPCTEGKEWYNNQLSFKEAWNNCNRGDWMLWIASNLKVDHRKLTLAKAYCARTVYHLTTNEKSKDAIIVSINYGRNLATKEELNTAANAAAYAANAAAANAAYTAYAATHTSYSTASYAANAAANAAADTHTSYSTASYAANAAANAATADTTTADYINAKIKNQKKTADICRKYLTEEVFNAINKL